MLAATVTLLAFIVALLGAFWLPDPATRTQGIVSVAVAAVLAVYGFRAVESIWPRPKPPVGPEVERSSAARLAGWMWLVVGVALIAWALIDVWTKPFAWNQAWRWFAGLLMAVFGCYLVGGQELEGEERRSGPGRGAPLRSPPEAAGAVWEPYMATWLQAVLLSIIMAAAIWMRVYKIGEMPPGIFIDETNAAMDALRIFEGRPDSLFGTGWFETPNGFVYLQTLFFRLLGTTFFAIKLQSLLPGILTVLALFFLTRTLFGPRLALFATAFLAFNRWHFNMSRWGWNEVYPPLMQLLSLFFIERGIRQRSYGDWALAGFLLGLGMYTYLSIRLVAVVIALYLLYRIILERGFFRRNWQGMVLFAVFYALTFAPLSFTYARNPFTLLNRTQQVSIMRDIEASGGDLQPLRESVKRHVQMFHITGDSNPRHNLPGEPMLDPVTGALYLLGLAWAVWRWRDHRQGLLLIWVGVTLLGGILSRLEEAPQTYRTLAVAPAVAILAADALDLGLRAIISPARRYNLWRWLWGLLAIAVLVVAGWLNYSLYWDRQAPSPSIYSAFTPLENEVAWEVMAKRDDHMLYLSPRLYHFSPLRFYSYQPSRPVGFQLGPLSYSPFDQLGGGLDQPGYQFAEPALDLPLPDLGGDNALFLLDTHFQYVLDYFRYFYPGTQAENVNDRLGRPLYLSVTIPGEEISAMQATNTLESVDEIRGLYIPSSGEYTLSAPGEASITLDGQIVDHTSLFLGKGLHALTISDLPAGMGETDRVIFWQGPAGTVPVPDEHLFKKPPSGSGLLGTYYQGSEWSPPPLMQQVDPFLLAAWPENEPVFGPFSVVWAGTLMVPEEGLYTFQLKADDGVRFWLDGEIVDESMMPDTANSIQPTLELTAGPHTVRIDFFQRGGGKAMEFFWQPPGQPMQPVATQYLQPSLD